MELNPGWIGGQCTSGASCSNASFTGTPVCVTVDMPGGFCTQSCTLGGSGSYICPDTTVGAGTLNTVTRCIDAAGTPQCVAECDFTLSPTGCRPGYTCELRERYNQSSKIFAVCLPSALERWPGEPTLANDIGGACASNHDCANKACIPMSGGYCTKMMCDVAGCPTGSACFILDSSGTTACLKTCSAANQCREAEGYTCDADSTCYPGATQGHTWNSAVGVADCANAWGSAGNLLSSCDTVKDHYIVVHKSARNVALCNAGSLVSNHEAGLGFAPTGDKVEQGDGKTPEGVFYVANTLPNSSYYKAFLISYPDKADATRGLTAGLISSTEKSQIDSAQTNCTIPPQSTGLGGYVEVHGNGGSSDWTLGCVGLADTSIDALWTSLKVGDTIVVLP